MKNGKKNGVLMREKLSEEEARFIREKDVDLTQKKIAMANVQLTIDRLEIQRASIAQAIFVGTEEVQNYVHELVKNHNGDPTQGTWKMDASTMTLEQTEA